MLGLVTQTWIKHDSYPWAGTILMVVQADTKKYKKLCWPTCATKRFPTFNALRNACEEKLILFVSEDELTVVSSDIGPFLYKDLIYKSH